MVILIVRLGTNDIIINAKDMQTQTLATHPINDKILKWWTIKLSELQKENVGKPNILEIIYKETLYIEYRKWSETNHYKLEHPNRFWPQSKQILDDGYRETRYHSKSANRKEVTKRSIIINLVEAARYLSICIENEKIIELETIEASKIKIESKKEQRERKREERREEKRQEKERKKKEKHLQREEKQRAKQEAIRLKKEVFNRDNPNVPKIITTKSKRIPPSGELIVEQCLTNKNIPFVRQQPLVTVDYVDMKGGGLTFDFYVPCIKLAVEVDGEQHRKPCIGRGGEQGFVDTLRRDLLKHEWCKQHTTSLLRVDYDDLKHIEEIIDTMITKIRTVSLVELPCIADEFQEERQRLYNEYTIRLN